MATVSTTFTFSSTDISSDSLSFTVSETLSLTGSGGLERIELNSATNSSSAYEVYNSESFSGNNPSFLYLKNVTGSGFSGWSTTAGTTNTVTTSSNVHLFTSGAGASGPGISGSYDLAVLKQGNFLYMPINPNTSYYVYTPTGSAVVTGGASGLTGTIIEYAVFK